MAKEITAIGEGAASKEGWEGGDFSPEKYVHEPGPKEEVQRHGEVKRFPCLHEREEKKIWRIEETSLALREDRKSAVLSGAPEWKDSLAEAISKELPQR